jgi:hypothetical protein
VNSSKPIVSYLSRVIGVMVAISVLFVNMVFVVLSYNVFTAKGANELLAVQQVHTCGLVDMVLVILSHCIFNARGANGLLAVW